MGDEPIRTRIQGSTRTLGVIGWPVAESLSPLIHNTAFIALDLDWVYLPLPVPPGRLREAIHGLEAVGFEGANVTMPHKGEAAKLVAELTEDARRLSAVNTIVLGPGGAVGHNTDAPGFDRFLRQDAGFDPGGRDALVFGAGGAARAAALALARGGLRRLIVAVRETRRADALVMALDGITAGVEVVSFGEAPEVEAALVVNATPLGTGGESLPHPPLSPDVLVVDLIYRPVLTPLQASARDAGATAFGGLGLLLHQAALSFELWTGQPAPLERMSAAAIAALADSDAAG
jgi:shikimate dehydrogenase